ncbi:protein Vhl [Drosophila takahashii]|uniref:protein Vhl n=1 Tax=Drosophila takahashii TaxID=29030 RepID=UPI0007E64EBC|nr:protein Vhl [Drosophila takahashii]
MALQIAQNNRDGQQLVVGEGEGKVEVYVLFANTTYRTLDLYWVSEQDREFLYLTLKPFEEVRVNTYSSHSWLFRDYYTGERMHVRSQRIFQPIRVRVPKNQTTPDELVDVRSEVLIHFPMRSLRENCLWLVARWLIRTSNTPRRIIYGYHIPSTLKQQLLSLLTCIESYSRVAGTRRRR